jgi:ankyrin repeat protein
MTALHFACMCKTADMAEILIEHKASVRAQNFWHWTPLHFAVRAKAHATVRVLLDNGADVDATTEGGHTPLHFAAANRDEKLMHILITEGKARQDMVNRSGCTPADEFRQHEVLYTM